MGRPILYAKEIHHMIVAENIVNAYRGRAAYKDKEGQPNWAEWASINPTLNKIIVQNEEILANGE
jgi:hypothetical protein